MIKTAKCKLLDNFVLLAFALAVISVYAVGEEVTEYIAFYGIYIFGTFIYLCKFEKEVLKSTALFLIPFIVFVLYLLLSLTWTRSPDETSFAGDRERFYATIGFVFVTTSIFSISDRTQKRLSYIIVAGSSIGAIIALIIFYSPETPEYRLTVADYNANIGGFIFSLSSILTLYIATTERKFILFIPYFLMSYVVFLTRSRGALLGLIIVSFIILIFELKSDKGWLLKLASIFGISVSILLMAGLLYPDVLMEFIGRADHHRFETWIYAVKSIMAYPLLGYGADADYASTVLPGMSPSEHPHNLVLGVLYYGGVVGLILFAWMYKGVILGLVAFRRETHAHLPIYLLLYFFAITAADTGRPLHWSPDVFFYWLPYTLAAGWILRRRRETFS